MDVQERRDLTDRIVDAWDRQGVIRDFGLGPNQLDRLATWAMEAITPACDQPHPTRPTVTCTEPDGHHLIWVHYNRDHKLNWDEDTGLTTHDDLGEIVLVAEQVPAPAVMESSPLDGSAGCTCGFDSSSDHGRTCPVHGQLDQDEVVDVTIYCNVEDPETGEVCGKPDGHQGVHSSRDTDDLP